MKWLTAVARIPEVFLSTLATLLSVVTNFGVHRNRSSRYRNHRCITPARSSQSAHMLGLPACIRIRHAAGMTDMRAGMNGLAARSKLRWPKTRTVSMWSGCADDAATYARSFGGPETTCVWYPSAMNETASFVHRRTAAEFP